MTHDPVTHGPLWFAHWQDKEFHSEVTKPTKAALNRFYIFLKGGAKSLFKSSFHAKLIGHRQMAKYHDRDFVPLDDEQSARKNQESPWCRNYGWRNKQHHQQRFVHFDKTSGEALYGAVKNALISVNLSLDDCRTRGFDAGGNMRGKFKGLATLITRDFPLVVYSYCAGHRHILFSKTLASLHSLSKELIPSGLSQTTLKTPPNGRPSSNPSVSARKLTTQPCVLCVRRFGCSARCRWTSSCKTTKVSWPGLSAERRNATTQTKIALKYRFPCDVNLVPNYFAVRLIQKLFHMVHFTHRTSEPFALDHRNFRTDESVSVDCRRVRRIWARILSQLLAWLVRSRTETALIYVTGLTSIRWQASASVSVLQLLNSVTSFSWRNHFALIWDSTPSSKRGTYSAHSRSNSHFDIILMQLSEMMNGERVEYLKLFTTAGLENRRQIALGISYSSGHQRTSFYCFNMIPKWKYPIKTPVKEQVETLSAHDPFEIKLSTLGLKLIKSLGPH